MKDLVLELSRGNPTEVKTVLASVALALAAYQLALIAVGYGRLRPQFLAAPPAARAHRAVGDTICVLVLVVAAMCLAVFGFDAESAVGSIHAVAAVAFIALLAVKVAVVRSGRLGSALPYLGSGVFVLLGVTWATSAGVLLVG